MFDHESLKVYLRDKIVDFDQGTVSISNTGFMYGLSCFTGMRAHYNKEQDKLFLFRARDHYNRFCFQCRLMRYDNFLRDYSFEKFQSIIVELLKVNEMRQDTYVRITNFTDENKVTPKFVEYGDALCMFLYPIGNYVPIGGMRCKVSSWNRVDDNYIPARGKITGLYTNTAFAKTEALIGGYDEAIFLDSSGHVVEGSAENIFIVYGDTLVTPGRSDAILEGVTRQSVMEIAKDEGLRVEERSIDRTELYRADEVFMTGTGAQVAPVIEVDDYPLNDRKIGPVSLKLQKLYFDAVRGESEKYMHWLTDVYA